MKRNPAGDGIWKAVVEWWSTAITASFLQQHNFLAPVFWFTFTNTTREGGRERKFGESEKFLRTELSKDGVELSERTTAGLEHTPLVC